MLKAAAIVLAGGKSTRMGSNKALLKVREQRMLEEAVNILSGKFEEVMVSTNDDYYEDLNIRKIPDVFPGRGPLGGIHAGLGASNYEVNFFMACDMPFVHAELAGFMVGLISGYDAVVPRIGEYYQPLFAVYNKSCLGPIEHQITSGRNKIISFYDQVRIRYVDEDELREYGNPDEMFFNVNTPVDLEAAKNLARRGKNGSEI